MRRRRLTVWLLLLVVIHAAYCVAAASSSNAWCSLFGHNVETQAYCVAAASSSNAWCSLFGHNVETQAYCVAAASSSNAWCSLFNVTPADTMRRRRLTVWLLLLVAAHGARTADPQLVDSTATNTEFPETTTDTSAYNGLHYSRAQNITGKITEKRTGSTDG
ncbi:hypothetical protein J6590_019173 [Homalodisca vitripennis]|nr:hypothetical protein J6590_019173 [Homalodisca vitripennis]